MWRGGGGGDYGRGGFHGGGGGGGGGGPGYGYYEQGPPQRGGYGHPQHQQHPQHHHQQQHPPHMQQGGWDGPYQGGYGGDGGYNNGGPPQHYHNNQFNQQQQQQHNNYPPHHAPQHTHPHHHHHQQQHPHPHADTYYGGGGGGGGRGGYGYPPQHEREPPRPAHPGQPPLPPGDPPPTATTTSSVVVDAAAAARATAEAALHNHVDEHVARTAALQRQLVADALGPMTALEQQLEQEMLMAEARGEPPRLQYASGKQLLRKPGRDSRPSHIVLILRGLPGAGKSHLARAIRDIEVSYGAAAPRTLALDDYFMTDDGPNGELVYEYEQELESAYRQSALKAFRKTIEDRLFSFIIVDNCNSRVSDYEQYMTIAKGAGYEVYVVQVDADPKVCAERNIHNRTLEEITKMHEEWEHPPRDTLVLDTTTLFEVDTVGDDIQEAEMADDDVVVETSPAVLTNKRRTSVPEKKKRRRPVLGDAPLSKTKWRVGDSDSEDEDTKASAKETLKASTAKLLSVDTETVSALKGSSVSGVGVSNSPHATASASVGDGKDGGWTLKGTKRKRDDDGESGEDNEAKRARREAERAEAEAKAKRLAEREKLLAKLSK